MNTTASCALVTGAAGGIGRAIALRLARDGWDIGVVDLDESGAEQTAALVRDLGRRACVAVGNVARRDSVQAVVARVAAALGPVDALVNNAGILRTARFLDISEKDWRDTLSVNLDGVFHCCQAVLPAMLARGAGCIVNMSSWTGKKGVPNHAAYSATKAGVIAITQSLAGEMAEHGIRVNAVCPGTIVDTQMRTDAETLNKAQGLPDIETRVRTQIPMRRAGLPADVAGVVSFLMSDDAAYMTGQAINVTGGLWMN
ncbi:MAG: SDR family NAD(P)-dependent oxidoreductase [Variovorax sp.]